MAKGKFLYEITARDVGKRTLKIVCECCGAVRVIYLSDVCGYIMDVDVGKRLFDVDGVVHIENEKQLYTRLNKALDARR